MIFWSSRSSNQAYKHLEILKGAIHDVNWNIALNQGAYKS